MKNNSFLLLTSLLIFSLANSQVINISTCSDLQNISLNLTASYCLTQDINCFGFPLVPIGNNSFPFKGSLDGNGHKITNVSLSPSTSNVGIFGYINGAMITNIVFQDFNFSSLFASQVGLVAGTASGGVIQHINLTSSGTVNNITALCLIISF